jgi:3-deoxy-D-manno-octulosonic-acid transferase
LRGLIRPLLGRISAVYPHDAATAARLRDLGLPDVALGRTAALKSAVTLSPPDPAAVAALGYTRHETVLAASTHPGEEEQVLSAFADARARRPGLRLILAPRHPERSREIARTISRTGLDHTTRSAGDAPGDAPVHLADTLGEMALWYAAAGLCYVGGSLVPKGGHTPYEPAQFDCAILHGPNVENAADAYGRLDASDGALAVADAAALAEAFVRLDADEQRAMAARARGTLAADEIAPLADALERVLGLAPQAERRP